MSKSLKEVLIAAITEQKLNFQFLSECCTGIKERKRQKCSEVSFLTDVITPNNVAKGDGKIGLILGIDPDFIAAVNNRSSNE